jgi:hypothetical protein
MHIRPKKKTEKKAPIMIGPRVRFKGKPAISEASWVVGERKERRRSFLWEANDLVHAVKIFPARIASQVHSGKASGTGANIAEIYSFI